MSHAPGSDDEPRRKVEFVEIHEEVDHLDPLRVLGSFELRLDGEWTDWDEEDEDLDGEDDEDEAGDAWLAEREAEAEARRDWTREQWEQHWAEEQRLSDEYLAQLEATAAAHPHRRLRIDEAITIARTWSDDVRVFLGDDEVEWDASTAPRGQQRTWPPEDLDLRPRWRYEPADSTRADEWWLGVWIRAQHLTPELAVAAAEQLPTVRAVRGASWSAHLEIGAPDDSTSRSEERTHVHLQCLVTPPPGQPVGSGLGLSHALEIAADGKVQLSEGMTFKVLGPSIPGELPPGANA